jgi:hypothetical protein
MYLILKEIFVNQKKSMLDNDFNKRPSIKDLKNLLVETSLNKENIKQEIITSNSEEKNENMVLLC